MSRMRRRYPPQQEAPPWAGYYYPPGSMDPVLLDPEAFKQAKEFFEQLEKQFEDKKKAADDKKKKEEPKKGRSFTTLEIALIMTFLSPLIGPLFMMAIKAGTNSMVEQLGTILK